MLRGRSVRSLCALAGMLPVGAAVTDAHAGDGPAKFDIYGFAMADAIYDFNRVDPAWDDTLRPSKIPTDSGTFGGDGQTTFSVKQSRFGVKGTMPLENGIGPIMFKFEFDMFGVGVDAGQTTIRLRHAYGEWGSLLAGQTNSLFMDGDVFPNVVDYWGPAGMVFYRTPQIRWTPYHTDTAHFSVAIEKPGNDIDPGQVREFDPELGSNIQNDEELPDFTAQGNLSGGWGHIQLAGILRRVGFETKGTTNNEPSDSSTGWGLDLTGHANIFRRDKLLLSVVYGEGIASYMNDGGVDMAPDGTLPDDVNAEAVPLLGVMAYLDHYWSDRWSTSLGYSMTQVDNTSLQDDTAFHRGEYASINLLYNPAPSILIGGEFLWGQRTDNDGVAADDSRFQFSVKYNFGTTVSL